MVRVRQAKSESERGREAKSEKEVEKERKKFTIYSVQLY